MVPRRQIFISSDWHLGGDVDVAVDGNVAELGTSIFRSTLALTTFLDSIGEAAKAFDGITEVVINGDMVDFLAPDQDGTYNPIAWQNDSRVIRAQLDNIANRFELPDGRGPFKSLRTLVDIGCELTVILGNHDLELCLPGVRRHFERLCAGDNGKIRFIYDGEAYTRGKLLIEHGNQYDPFNAVDYNLLRQERSHLSRGFVVDDAERGERFFDPPPGSSIVVDIVNPTIREAPFLNLLKPEVDAAVPLLLAFYPETRPFFEAAFRRGWKLFRKTIRNNKESNPALMAAGEQSPYRSLNDFLRDTMGNDAEPFLSPPSRSGQLSDTPDAHGSLMRTLSEQASRAIDLTCPWKIYDNLKASMDEGRMNLVRLALKRVRDADSFDRKTESERYLAPSRKMTEYGGYDVVIFGHTHFPKDIELPHGRYINAGTWADVLRLPSGISSDNAATANLSIEKFLNDMKSKNYTDYTIRNPSFVHAVVEPDGSVDAKLKTADNKGEVIGG
ncbi:metallophosphoesterase family protein [Rhodopirellula bahusiensis]|uniref:Calcineurin-like phosphoesterase domain-containing protein n=1 Tax=Rhodopirellula bahusiensis TaxID=2014065 RepID=A0A2G1W2F2_9BACT|nr:hypothetical protein [Rhodopirellula bahusiensis]PHQ33151.1 hypothetical protein CEE69_22070 [Rhodopirellula bahusiensis]